MYGDWVSVEGNKELVRRFVEEAVRDRNLEVLDDIALRYLDADPQTVKLVAEGSYVRAEDPTGLLERARVAVLPPRIGTTVHAWRLCQIGFCIPGSTAHTDTSLPPTAWRLPTTSQEPVDALRMRLRTRHVVRTDPPGRASGNRTRAGGARRSPAAAPTVGHGEVVEDQQVARLHRDLELDGIDVQPKGREEAQLGGKSVELHPAQKAGGVLDAREARRAGRRLDNASEATLAVAVRIVPRPVRIAVRHDVVEKRRLVRPGSSTKKRAQRHNRVIAVTPTAERGINSAVYRATS